MTRVLRICPSMRLPGPGFGSTSAALPMTVYDRTTNELCSDYAITGLRLGRVRDLPDLPPISRN